MRRREFIVLIGGVATCPLSARAQQPIRPTGKTPHVGALMPGSAAHSAATLGPFYQGLHDLGYTEGQNLSLELRNADWKPDRLPALAVELVGLKVDIIVAWSTHRPPRKDASTPFRLSERVVLTAAHCIQDDETGAFFDLNKMYFLLQYQYNDFSQAYRPICASRFDG